MKTILIKTKIYFNRFHSDQNAKVLYQQEKDLSNTKQDISEDIFQILAQFNKQNSSNHQIHNHKRY